MNRIITDISFFGGWLWELCNALIDFVLEGFDGD